MRYLAGTFVWVRCEDGIWWPARIPEGVSEEEIRAIEPDKDMCVEFFHHPGAFYTVCSSDAHSIQRMHFSAEEKSPLERQFFANSAVQMAVKKACCAYFGSSLNSKSEDDTVVPPPNFLHNTHEQKNFHESVTLAAISSSIRRESAVEKKAGIGTTCTNRRRAPATKDVLASFPSHFTTKEKKDILELMGAIRPSTIRNALQGMNSSPSSSSSSGEHISEVRNCQGSDRLLASTVPTFSSSSSNKSMRISESSRSTLSPLSCTETGNEAFFLESESLTFNRSDFTESGSASFPASLSPSPSSLLDSTHSSPQVALLSDPSSPQSHPLPGSCPEGRSRNKRTQLPRGIVEGNAQEGVAESHRSPSGDIFPVIMNFIPPVSHSVLQVIRSAVLDDASRFVLSPVYRLLDVLGAVNISSQSVRTNFPTPYAVREILKETPINAGTTVSTVYSSRRVLLLPLSCSQDGNYDHQMGWMQPTLLDDIVLEMRIRVNGSEVATPQNWNIAAAKEKKAVKTAPTIDVTSLVMLPPEQSETAHMPQRSLGSEYRSTITQEDIKEEDIFTLEVQFSELPNSEEDNSLLLWDGLIVALYVDTVPLTEIENSIITYYRPPISEQPSALSTTVQEQHPLSSTSRSGKRKREYDHTVLRKGRKISKSKNIIEVQNSTPNPDTASENISLIHVVRGTIGVHCPLTKTPMATPVKSVYCEHLQCMELSAVLLQFIRSNIWNCPLCGEDMRPSSIWVHHQLRLWIQQHSTADLQRIDYIVVNENNTFHAHYTSPRAPPTSSIHLID